jgi:class 3 adenylate cyclase
MLRNKKEITGFFVFMDLRGFTLWAESNQTEIDILLSFIYQLGFDTFGERKEATFPKRIVKFLGDGFFAVNEYKRNDDQDFETKMNETLKSCSLYILKFRRGISEINIHEREKIGIGFGVSYGSAIRFTIPGHPMDYSGKHVNYSARLCSKAENGEMLLEKEFDRYHMRIVLPEMYYYEEKEIDMKSIGKYNAISIKPRKLEDLDDLISISK